jgi:hypothetical protein
MVHKRFALRFSLLLMMLACVSLACQASGSVPSFLAPATPIPSITPQPPTATSLPTSTPSLDISLEPQVDGSSLFTDPKTGFSLLIPSTWVGIPANVDDITPYVEQVSENNPQFSEALSMLQKIDPNILRVMVLDSNIDHYTGNYVPNFTVLATKDPRSTKMSLKSWVKLMEISVKSQFPQANMLNSGVEQVSSGFSYGYIELQIPFNGPGGGIIKVYQKQAFFPVQDYLVVMTLSAHPSKHDDVLLEFNEIIKTVQRLDQ